MAREARGVFAVGASARWDERRNTSAVHPVPPDALPAALRALAEYRRRSPEAYAWAEAGSPPIRTQEDHVRWFGRPYEPSASPRRRRAAEPAA